MFEQEIEMEKKQSSVVPLLMIIGLIVSIVGVAFYYLLENRKVLTVQEADPDCSGFPRCAGAGNLAFSHRNHQSKRG